MSTEMAERQCRTRFQCAGNLFFKIQMIMPAAIWVEGSVARGTMVARIKVLVDR